MAEISKFFNSTVTDERWYQAQDFAEYFWMFLTSGLIHVDREPFINVEVVEDSLQLKVTPGPALIKGHLYRNTKDLYLTVDTPDVLEDRFDRLVLQLDLVPEDGKAGRIKALIKKGVASNDPVVPDLTRNERIFELSLGYFRVRKNTASIAQLDYVDERLHEDHCGIVNSLITVPTHIFEERFNKWMNIYSQTMENNFNTWFDEIKAILDENTAGNLLKLIEQNKRSLIESFVIKRNVEVKSVYWEESEHYYFIEIEDNDITEDSLINVNIHKEYLLTAAYLLPITESHDDKFILYSTQIPKGNILVDYTINKEVK